MNPFIIFDEVEQNNGAKVIEIADSDQAKVERLWIKPDTDTTVHGI
ncbi:hypothetical protein LCGC14_1488100, partial [marine sediment metagenome]